jgi:hypothetical protein
MKDEKDLRILCVTSTGSVQAFVFNDFLRR